MARIPTLPSLDIIRGLKGTLDFYLWKGLPCVRAWPKYRPAKQTEASLAAALLFGAIIKAYSMLAPAALEAYRELAVGIPRTARDLMVSGVYGNLHEASMSDFLDLLTQCRDFLSNLQALLTALDSIDTDELVVNIDESVLPAGASTAANQATALTALQKLDDLQHALQSKHLDRLLVRGMDQLFTIKRRILYVHSYTMVGDATHLFYGNVVPADEYWILTSFSAWNEDGATSPFSLGLRQGTGRRDFTRKPTVPTNTSLDMPGSHVLQPNDSPWARFGNVHNGDRLRLAYNGYALTRET